MHSAGVHISIDLDAPATAVWRAWTEPAMVLRWFGSDPTGWGVAADMDVRSGGAYRITFQNGDGTEYTCLGTYEVVAPFQTLSFSWSWLNEPGHVSLVTVRLAADGEGTTMSFTHTGLWADSEHGYEEGWGRTFEKLRRVLAS